MDILSAQRMSETTLDNINTAVPGLGPGGTMACEGKEMNK